MTEEEKLKLLEKCLSSAEGLENLARSFRNPMSEYMTHNSLSRRLLRVDPLPSGVLPVYKPTIVYYVSHKNNFLCWWDKKEGLPECVNVDVTYKYQAQVRVSGLQAATDLTNALHKLSHEVATRETELLFRMINHFIERNYNQTCFNMEITADNIHKVLNELDPTAENSNKVNGIVMGLYDWKRIKKHPSIDKHHGAIRHCANNVASLCGIPIYLRKSMRDKVYFFPPYEHIGVLVERGGDTPLLEEVVPYRFKCILHPDDNLVIDLHHTFGMVVNPTDVRMICANEKKIKKSPFNRYTALTKVV